MIILFHLKLDKFYCTEVMNQLEGTFFFIHLKISYCWFNRQESLHKAKGRYYNGGGKEEAADYYIANKDVLKEKAKYWYRNMPKEEKEAKRAQSRNRYQIIFKKIDFLYSIKMSKKILKIGDVEVNIREFPASK